MVAKVAVEVSERTKTMPPDIRLVKEPVKNGKVFRPGVYGRILRIILGLEKTSWEYGLSPHYEWPAKSRAEMKTRMAGLLGFRRRHKDEFEKIGLSQQANNEKNEYRIFLWHQE